MLGRLCEFALLLTVWKVHCRYCCLDGTGILYFVCVFSSAVQKSFLDSFEMTYLNYIVDILDLQKKKLYVHFTRRAQYVSVLIRQTHYVSIVHLKHIMCPLYIVRKTRFVTIMHV